MKTTCFLLFGCVLEDVLENIFWHLAHTKTHNYIVFLFRYKNLFTTLKYKGIWEKTYWDSLLSPTKISTYLSNPGSWDLSVCMHGNSSNQKESSLFWIQAWPAHLLLDLGMAPGEGAYWTTKINLKNKYHQNKIIENYTNEHN